jgi:hypothetical protein
MSFDGASSGALVSFRPGTLHVRWDGVSDARASIALSCFDTAASYAASAYPVFNVGGSTVAGSTASPTIYTWARGDRIFTVNNDGTRTFLPDVTLPSTVASSTATIRFASITTTSFTHAWRLTGTKGTVTRVVVGGGVFIQPPGPYEVQTFVGGVTTSGCF